MTMMMVMILILVMVLSQEKLKKHHLPYIKQPIEAIASPKAMQPVGLDQALLGQERAAWHAVTPATLASALGLTAMG